MGYQWLVQNPQTMKEEIVMPRKAKAETTAIPTKPKVTAATKTKKDAATNTKVKTKASKAKLKSTKPNITETPKHSEVILEYSRFGNIGFSTIHETVDISFLTKKKFIGRINALFHFLRNTPVTSDIDSGRTATFQIDGRPVIGIVQKAGDYENQVFTLTRYKADGTRQSTRKYFYNKAKNLILDAFGFETKIDEDAEAEESETSNEDSVSMGNMEILTDAEKIEYDTNSGFDEMD